jgi:hypothetical protein
LRHDTDGENIMMAVRYLDKGIQIDIGNQKYIITEIQVVRLLYYRIQYSRLLSEDEHSFHKLTAILDLLSSAINHITTKTQIERIQNDQENNC